MNKLQSVMLSLSIAFGLSAVGIATPEVRLETELVKMQEEILREGQYINHQATDARRLFRRWKHCQKLTIFNRLVLAHKLLHAQAELAETRADIEVLINVDRSLAQEVQKDYLRSNNNTLNKRTSFDCCEKQVYLPALQSLSDRLGWIGFKPFDRVLKLVNSQSVKNRPFVALYNYKQLMKDIDSVQAFETEFIKSTSSDQVKKILDKDFAVENEIWSNLAKIQHSASLHTLLEKKREQGALWPVLDNLKNNKSIVPAGESSAVVEETASDEKEEEIITPAQPVVNEPQPSRLKRFWNWAWNKVEQHPVLTASAVLVAAGAVGLASGVIPVPSFQLAPDTVPARPDLAKMTPEEICETGVLFHAQLGKRMVSCNVNGTVKSVESLQAYKPAITLSNDQDIQSHKNVSTHESVIQEINEMQLIAEAAAAVKPVELAKNITFEEPVVGPNDHVSTISVMEKLTNYKTFTRKQIIANRGFGAVKYEKEAVYDVDDSLLFTQECVPVEDGSMFCSIPGTTIQGQEIACKPVSLESRCFKQQNGKVIEVDLGVRRPAGQPVYEQGDDGFDYVGSIKIENGVQSFVPVKLVESMTSTAEEVKPVDQPVAESQSNTTILPAEENGTQLPTQKTQSESTISEDEEANLPGMPSWFNQEAVSYGSKRVRFIQVDGKCMLPKTMIMKTFDEKGERRFKTLEERDENCSQTQKTSDMVFDEHNKLIISRVCYPKKDEAFKRIVDWCEIPGTAIQGFSGHVDGVYNWAVVSREGKTTYVAPLHGIVYEKAQDDLGDMFDKLDPVIYILGRLQTQDGKNGPVEWLDKPEKVRMSQVGLVSKIEFKAAS